MDDSSYSDVQTAPTNTSIESSKHHANMWRRLTSIRKWLAKHLHSLYQSLRQFSNYQMFSGFIFLRVLKALGYLHAAETLQQNINICLESLESLGAITILKLSLFSIFAISSRVIFSSADPSRFGSLYKTAYTLFQILTLDDWSLTYNNSSSHGAWYIIIFLILYISIVHFVSLNLFIAVLVDNFKLLMSSRKKETATDNKLLGEEEEEKKEAVMSKASTSFAEEEDQEDVETDDETFLAKIIQENSDKPKVSSRDKQLLFKYLKLRDLIDKNKHLFEAQAITIDSIMDTFFEEKASIKQTQNAAKNISLTLQHNIV